MANIWKFGLVWFGFEWYGTWVMSRCSYMQNFKLIAYGQFKDIWFGLLRLGLVWFGLEWYGLWILSRYNSMKNMEILF